ncbi:MAG: DUF1772 domain-containing protein [Kibdelosporangium sp.]
MELVRGGVLIVTTVLLGLISGLFYTYTVSVLVSLRTVDDRTFVDVMQRINRDIQNPRFFLSFIGSLLFLILSLLLFVGVDGDVVLPVLISLVFYVLSFGTTIGGNVPMNVRLDRRGDPDRIADLAGARKEFEARWTRLNTLRGLFSTVAMATMCWALIEFGG